MTPGTLPCWFPVCLFDWILYVPVNIFYNFVGMEPPVLNQYYAEGTVTPASIQSRGHYGVSLVGR